MKRKIVFLVFMGLLGLKGMSQHNKNYKHPFFDKVRFGGGIGINIGSNYSSFSISPSAVYDFSEQFSMGGSITYMYVKQKSTISRTTNVFGGSVLALYRPINYLQISTEYENLKLNSKFNRVDYTSKWQPALYLGIEYVTGNIAMGLRYDVLFDKQENLLYSSAISPIFRIYF